MAGLTHTACSRRAATAGVALLGAGMLVTIPATPSTPGIAVRDVQLTAGEDVGYVVGGSSIPIPEDVPG